MLTIRRKNPWEELEEEEEKKKEEEAKKAEEEAAAGAGAGEADPLDGVSLVPYAEMNTWLMRNRMGLICNCGQERQKEERQG